MGMQALLCGLLLADLELPSVIRLRPGISPLSLR
jgi:hypothetical protein